MSVALFARSPSSAPSSSPHLQLERRHLRRTTPKSISRIGTATSDRGPAEREREDQDLTQRIRRSVIDDKALSTYAHNVKIIAQDELTLKGPVRTENEGDRRARPLRQARDTSTTDHDRPEKKWPGESRKKTSRFPCLGCIRRCSGRGGDERPPWVFQRRRPVLMADNGSSKDFAHQKDTKGAGRTTTGVAAGNTVGGTLAYRRTAPPSRASPSSPPGPIMGALAGLGVGGAVSGLVGADCTVIPGKGETLRGSREEGGILMSVHCDTSTTSRARKRSGSGPAPMTSLSRRETVGATASNRSTRTM